METHASKAKSHAVSAKALKYEYEDEQRLIVMESEAQCSLCRDSALVTRKARLATEVQRMQL